MVLTPESITDTALDVLSRFGMGDLSMRRLARELDVAPSALYWHVTNKQEVFVLVARRFTAEVDARCPVASRPDPRIVCMTLRDVLLGYRDGAEIYSVAYALHPDEVVPAGLSALPSASALDPRVRALMSFVLGSLIIEQSRALFERDSPDDPEVFVAGMEALLRGFEDDDAARTGR